MGRSRGGLTTKIHAVADVTGLPIRYDLSPGQAHDTTAAGAMLATLPPDSSLVADKAYDAEWIRDLIEQRDAVPIIPDRQRAKTRHAFSKPLYRLRNRIERKHPVKTVEYFELSLASGQYGRRNAGRASASACAGAGSMRHDRASVRRPRN